MLRFIKSLYFDNLFFILLIINIIMFVFGHFVIVFYLLAKLMLLAILVLTAVNILLIYNSTGLFVSRELPERLSNGDKNEILFSLKNKYRFPIQVKLIDEIPFQFQVRDFLIAVHLEAFAEKQIAYHLIPKKRGEYSFGNLNAFVTHKIGLIWRRYTFDYQQVVPVYPSFMQMKQFELMAISNRLTELGVKKIRRISNNNEFEQIREYVKGDDYRTINWKATARSPRLMVNQYQDEKSQQVYCLIDMGRNMQMPFEGMTLLDYAINASLVISNIAMHKHDKAGLITYGKRIGALVKAERGRKHLMQIMQVLYRQKTNFLESNNELLYVTVKQRIKRRSLLLLFTNFEGVVSLERQLNYFKQLAKSHLLVVIFFKNTELNALLAQKAENIEQVYEKTIAEKFDYEKRLIIKELQKNGIFSVLSEPKNLTVDTLNKYLELKMRGVF